MIVKVAPPRNPRTLPVRRRRTTVSAAELDLILSETYIAYLLDPNGVRPTVATA